MHNTTLYSESTVFDISVAVALILIILAIIGAILMDGSTLSDRIMHGDDSDDGYNDQDNDEE